MFRKPREIENQLKEFISYKKEKYNLILSVNYTGWLRKFIVMTKVGDMKDATISDIMVYKEWVVFQYASEYMRREAIHPLNCFLRFTRRHDIIREMNRLGRKPNLEKVQIVKKYRKANVPYRDIQNLLEIKEGKKYDLKTLFFWGNYKRPKLLVN